MATAVEMTIALGRTHWGAPGEETDNDKNSNDETIEGRDTIEGRETRVSVTWRLTEGDQNLPLTASLLAEKTVQMLETADRTVRCEQEKSGATEQVPVQSRPPAPPASVPPASGAASTNGAAGNGTASRSYSAAYVPPITKAQNLAIGSLCARHGIADWELRRLVWEQFGKKEQGELTKDQAGELLNVLQRNAASDGASDHAYAQ